MDGNYTPYNPRTVEEVFKDFKGRRAGMIKALTNDVDDFYQQCDPGILKDPNIVFSNLRVDGIMLLPSSIVNPLIFFAKAVISLHCSKVDDGFWKDYKENLCLYGFPSEQWEVNLPAEEIPPELPEPALGINFARDGMREEDWLSLVAVHSDAWLISVAFYFGARFGFDKAERKRLFDMINDLPTIFEVVSRKHNARSSGPYYRNNKSKSIPKMQHALDPQAMMNTKGSQQQEEEDEDVEEEEEEDEHADALCGACGENYGSGEFWICCDVCEKWFHGKCVKITPAKAEHIKQYKCPACSNNKKSRPS